MDAAQREDQNGAVIGGYCVSACAMIFLAGVSRAFGDLVAPADESLGFHGSYAKGELKGSARLDALKTRIMQRTGNKAPSALVDRWLHITDDKSSMRFRYPVAGANGPLVYFCSVGTRANKGDFSGCDPVTGTDAYAAGIITTRTVEHIEQWSSRRPRLRCGSACRLGHAGRVLGR